MEPAPFAKAFDSAFRAHYAAMCDVVFGYVHDRDAAEDIVQAVWQNVWRQGNDGGEGRLTPQYLYRAARNGALTDRRNRQVTTSYRETTQAEWHPADDSVSATLEHAELQRLVANAIAALPERQREVYLLVRGHRWPHAQVAERLGISVATVEMHMWRALKTLRAALGPYLLGLAMTWLAVK